MNRKITIYAVIDLLVIFLLSSCNTNPYKSHVQEYILTLEPLANSLDVKTTLEITYLVEGPQPKNDGFKFVGSNEVDSLVCSDEKGVILSHIEYLKETRISWQFEPISSGTKKIKATFILRGMIEKTDNKFNIKASWAGVFRIPVLNARYNILLPPNLKRLKLKEPTSWEQEKRGNLDCYYYVQAPLKNKTIKVQFEK